MKIKSAGLIIRTSLLALAAISLSSSADDAERQVFETIGRIKPALVRIHVVSVEDEMGRETKSEAVGSGVIITAEGHVVTNHHVAGKAKRIMCTLSDKTEIKAELTGTDPLSDISVIRLLPEDKRRFPCASFGNSDSLEVGDQVLALGSPMALSQSVTMGIVSNTELVIPELFWPYNKFTLEGEDVGSIVRWIGHDAAIYGGNSGGPLVNLKGEIVGINEISLGISGAIPGNLARAVAGELIRNGRISRAWLGIEVQPLFKDMAADKGVLVAGVIDGSPASRAGFKAGDILIELAGRDQNIHFAEELAGLNQFVMALPIGKPAPALVRRSGREIRLSITPEEREYYQPKTEELKSWGITAGNLSTMIAREMKRKDRNGVLIETVRPGGPCGDAKPPIIDGDIIVSVAEEPVNDLKALKEITQRLAPEQSEPVPTVVGFERGNEKFLSVVRIGLKKAEDQGYEATKAWLPVATQVLTRDLAEKLGIAGQKGVRVIQVYKNLSAEKAGLKVGDIITAVDQEPVDAYQMSDNEVFPVMIQRLEIGRTAELTVIRGRDRRTIAVELLASPKPPQEMKKFLDDDFDFEIRDIAFLDRVELDLPNDQQGVMVEDVSMGGWASLAHLTPGDIILSVDNEPAADVAGFEKIMARIDREKPETTIFEVLRGIHTAFLEMETDWKK